MPGTLGVMDSGKKEVRKVKFKFVAYRTLRIGRDIRTYFPT